MSNQEVNQERQIIEIASSALLIRRERESNPILSEMVSSALIVAAESGLANLDAEELVRMGKTILHSDGLGATETNIKAFSLFYRAAQTGHPEAEWLVYRCIREGDGVEHDYGVMIQWLKKACESGWHEAEYREAIAYFYGEYGIPDLEESTRLLELAASKDNIEAMAALGVLLTFYKTNKSQKHSINRFSDRIGKKLLADVGISRNELEYFTKKAETQLLSASLEQAEAQYTLARIYCERIDYFPLEDKKDYFQKALELSYESSLKGYAPSCIFCSTLLIEYRHYINKEHELYNKVPAEFIKYLKDIASSGCTNQRIDALEILERAHKYGRLGLDLNLEESRYYLELGANLGSLRALGECASLENVKECNGEFDPDVYKSNKYYKKSREIEVLNELLALRDRGFDLLDKSVKRLNRLALRHEAIRLRMSESKSERDLSLVYRILASDSDYFLFQGDQQFLKNIHESYNMDDETDVESEVSSDYDRYFFYKIACLLDSTNIYHKYKLRIVSDDDELELFEQTVEETLSACDSSIKKQADVVIDGLFEVASRISNLKLPQ